MTALIATAPAQLQTASQSLSAQLFARWIAFIDASPKTVSTYARNIRHFIAFINERGITAPTRADIVAYRDYLKESHKAATVQGYLTSVKLFFRWAQQENLYPNIADRVKAVRLEAGHKKDYLTSAQTARLLAAIDRSTLQGLRDYAICALMLTTGLREISVIRADIGDIRTAGDSAALFYQGKGRTEKADYVKLAPQVEDAIRSYLKARGESDPSAPLFAATANRNNGGRMTTRSLSRIAKTRLIAAGLQSDRLTGHSFRHTAATLNLLAGGSLEETRQLLGHRSINTTLIYSHALERAANNSEQRIAAAIFG